MMERCRNKSIEAYPLYGGRGIKVCERWHNVENFVADMAPRPDGLSLDRIDSNGNYEPSNCRWATPIEQQNNKRNNRLLTFSGETKTLMQWARSSGINRGTINSRVKAGWPAEEIFLTPRFSGCAHAVETALKKAAA